MCLHVKMDAKPKVSNEDIHTVKFLYVTENGELYSPFKDFRYIPNVPYHLSGSMWQFNRMHYESEQDGANIMEGYHSVAGFDLGHLHQIKSACQSWRDHKDIRPFRAVIPAGTPYWEGVDDWNFRGYCSKSIIIKEEIK